MSKVKLDISMSLDGFVAGPDPTLEDPLGKGGEQLHEWIFGLASWREPHGRTGGERNADDDLVREGRESTGAVIMGRRMFSGGAGPWEDDPKATAGGVTSRPSTRRCSSSRTTSESRCRRRAEPRTTFVTDGIESALEQARDGGRRQGRPDRGRGGGGSAVSEGGTTGRDPAPRRAGAARRRRPALRRSRPRRREARAGRRGRVPEGHARSLPSGEVVRQTAGCHESSGTRHRLGSRSRPG